MITAKSNEVLRLHDLDGQFFEPFCCSIKAGTGAIILSTKLQALSELVDLVSGLEPSLSGTIHLMDVGDPAADPDDWKHRSRHIGFAAGDADMISNLKVFENLLLPLQTRGNSRSQPPGEELEPQILEAFEAAGLGAEWVHSTLPNSTDNLSRFERIICALVRCHLNGFKLLIGEQLFAELDSHHGARLTGFLDWLGMKHPESGLLLMHQGRQAPDLSTLSSWQPIETLNLDSP